MSTGEPTFQRVAGTDLFWLTGCDHTLGYQATPGASLGDAPTLSATWTLDPGGVYLLLGAAPAADAAFATALLAYLEGQGWPSGQRFLWLAEPGQAVWDGQLMSLAGSSGAWTVARRADYRLANYTLAVASGSAVTLATEAQGWGFCFTPGEIPVATFFAPGGEWDVAGGLLLPFTGAQAGCWRFGLTLSRGGGAVDDFTQLGVGIRYFHPDRSGGLSQSSAVGVVHLPTLVQPSSPLGIDASIDPLRATQPARTWLSFFPPGVSPPPFGSRWATVRGYPITLSPLAGAGSAPDARLVFAEQPRTVGPDPVPKDLYLTPQGAFAIGFTQGESVARDAAGTPVQRLLCGESGLEYLGLPDGQQSRLVFVPGRPAYAPMLPASDGGPALTSLGTTSWIWAGTTGTAGIRYYAQPEDAPLFHAPPATGAAQSAGTDSVFLDFLQVAALELAPSDGVRCFPAAAYLGLDPNEVEAALALEAAALAPVRRQAILNADHGAWSQPPSSGDGVGMVGVTPQGLSVGIGSDGMTWRWVGIGNDGEATPDQPDLVFTQASGAFRQALQTNRLFLVAANPDVFMQCASVRYQLTAQELAELQSEGAVPAEILNAVAAQFAQEQYPVYQDEASFVAALSRVAGAAAYARAFERKAGLLAPRIGDWRFQISPRNWDNPQRTERQNAFLIFKFDVGRSLAELTAELSAWSWPEVGALPGGTTADSQRELQSIFAEARKARQATAGSGIASPYAHLVALLDDPAWTGIISFGCDVPLDALPGPLQALAAGIDPKRFYAHHLGFTATPFSARPGVLQFGRSAAFGLIDYQDPTDQYFQEDRAFMFKVLQLTVGFQSSVMTDFSSRLELLVNRLFGAPVTLYPTDHGNNVILEGVYQRQTDASGAEQGAYVFSMERQNTAGLGKSALRWVRLLSAQMVTTEAGDPDDPTSRVVAQFRFGGDMQFTEAKGCDLFSFGEPMGAQAVNDGQGPTAETGSALRFGNLVVEMSFTLADPTPSFAFVTEALSFDLASSAPRPRSLFALFPLRLSGILATPDPAVTGVAPAEGASAQGPATLGFTSIGAPIQQASMTDPWYGLVYDVDLGTLGALAGSVGLTLSLLVAWSGGGTEDAPAVYVGARLPGVKGLLGVELPLQGIVSLGFKTIQLLVDDTTDAQGAIRRQYLLRFRNFALRFLGLSFPPGYNDILLAGNPDASSPTKLGWYAAYAAEDDPKKKGVASRTVRQVAARRLPAKLLSARKRGSP